MKHSRYRQVRTGTDLFAIYYAWSCKDCGVTCSTTDDANRHDEFHDALDSAGIIL